MEREVASSVWRVNQEGFFPSLGAPPGQTAALPRNVDLNKTGSAGPARPFANGVGECETRLARA